MEFSLYTNYNVVFIDFEYYLQTSEERNEHFSAESCYKVHSIDILNNQNIVIMTV